VKPGIKELHKFIMGPFTTSIRDAYEHLEIITEADLQAVAWHLIREFLREYDPAKKKLKVLNKPYLKRLRVHPDIVIFRKGKAWVLIELKERKKLTASSAKKEWDRLVKAKKRILGPKRGYLIYVARWGDKRVLHGLKGRGARFFFEIPILWEDFWPPERIIEWEKTFLKWAKFGAGG
jgi:hypothetical protein